MNVATILAAGQGKRFGADVPKQFIEVLSKPVLAYTLETFQRSPDIDAIQIVCRPEYKDRIIEIVRNYRIDKIRWITEGGSTRSESFRNAIFALKDIVDDNDKVVAHPGVSPLVSLEDIASSVAMCEEKGCCFTMHPIRMSKGQCMGFDVGVDSGQAGLFDASHYRDDTVIPNHENLKDKEPSEIWYDHCCNITLSPLSAGVLPYGVVSSSGYGDGGYDCFICRNEYGQIIRAEIEFIPEDDYE